MKTSAITILIVVISIIGTSAVFLVRNALTGENNFDLLTDVLHPCEPFPKKISPRMVVIRIDDIQAFGWEDVAMQMIEDALKQQVPPVLGVIPKGIRESARMYSYLRANRCNLEMAEHGWDHGEESGGVLPEFEGMNEGEAYRDINEGKLEIERLSRERVMTFIPPNNAYSTGTAAALLSLGIPAVSSEGKGYFDYSAQTFDYDTDTLVPALKVIEACEARFEKSDVCVIMLHPQDFVTANTLDTEKYKTYTTVLDVLKEKNVTFVRIKDIINQKK